MIRINLLPFRAARRKENVRRQISIYVLSVGLLLLVVGYLFWDLTSTLSDLADQKVQKKRELDKYAVTIKRIDTLNKKIAEIKAKLQVIKDLQKNKTGPVRLLDEIAAAVPKGRLWLSTLSEKDGTLTLTGTAMDNDTVARFMTQLEAAKLISSVKLESTVMKNLKEQKLNVSVFTLKCGTYLLKKEEEKAPAAKKGRKRRR
jgi:type IV pilus assembly protein PilN